MPDERAIVRPTAALTPDSHRRASTGSSSTRDDAHAVVIGINEYVDPKIPNLRFARADAQAIYDVLIDPEIGRFKPENVTLLVDSQATERNIRSALGTQLPRRAEHDSTVVIYFAGHGAPVVDTRAHSADGLEKYLIPYDAVADDLRASGISMDAVQQYFSWLDASQVVCFLDSCYSGTAGGRSFDHPSYQTRAMLSDEFLDSLGSEGRFVVTACATNEVSLEDPKLGHGIFTQRLVEGLRGAADTDADGRVTIDELYEYVYKNVERDARLLGGSMNPVKKGSVQGRIYITEYETENKKRVRALLQSASEARTRGDNSAALALYRDALGLDPANVEATEGSAAAAAIAHERDAGVKRQQRLLLGHVNSGDLTMRDYNRALSSLEADPASLDTHDLQYRRLVDAVVAGELTIRSFVRSTELLDSETGEHSQPSATPVSATPASATPTSANPSSTSGATQAAVVTSPQPSAREPTSSAKNPSPRAKEHERSPSPIPRSSGSRWLTAIGGLAVAVIAFFILRPHPGPVSTPDPIVVDSAKQPNPNSQDTQRLADSVAAAQAVAANRTAAVAHVPSGESPTTSGGQAAASTARQSKKASDRTPQPTTESPPLRPLKLPTVEPADGSTSVSIEAQITLHFTDLAPGDEIDRSSLALNISLMSERRGGLALVLGADATTVRITPTAKLDEDTRYSIYLFNNLRTKLGRSLQVRPHYTFSTVTVDPLYFYRLINPNHSQVEALTADSKSCRMEQEQSGGNQAWYFTRPKEADYPLYSIMHNAFGGGASGLENPVSPGVCRLNAGAESPPMLWRLVPVPGMTSRYFLQNANFGPAQSLSVGTSGPMMQPTDPRDPQQWWMLQRQQRR